MSKTESESSLSQREAKKLAIDKAIIEKKTELYNMELEHRQKEQALKKELSELNTRSYHYLPYVEKKPKDSEYFKMYQRKLYQERFCKKTICDVCGREVTVGEIRRHKKRDICKKYAQFKNPTIEEDLKENIQ